MTIETQVEHSLRNLTMIKNIEIRNFRCFEKTKIPNFKRINLISGKNNSGKTALLEALYLINSPKSTSISYLKRLRRESAEFLKNLPERAWDNFFYNQNREEMIHIVSEDVEGTTDTLEISCDESVEELSNLIREIEEREEQDVINVDDKDIVDLHSLLTEKKYSRSTLRLNWITDNKKHLVATMVAYSEGILRRDLKVPDVKKVNFIPASMRLSSAALAQEYDKADLNDNADKVVEAIRVIDDTIDQVKTFNIGEAAVYLKRQKNSILPISLFGEATNKVADFILRLVNDRESILLIDEIENGIHYTSHKELWRLIFKLAVQCDVQIFTTTHSGEMLRAFVDVSLEDNNNELGAYIELTKNINTHQIMGIQHDIEALKYEIERNMGVRGE